MCVYAIFIIIPIVALLKSIYYNTDNVKCNNIYIWSEKVKKSIKYFPIIVLMLILSISLKASYKIAGYTKVTSVSGTVTISSQDMILKQAKKGDLLFIKDNIKTGNMSSLTGYLEGNNVFKIKANTSLSIQDSFDKSKRMHFYINEGTLLVANSIKSPPDSLTIGTPNSSISINGGAALISYYKGVTKAVIITGSSVINGETVPALMEAKISNNLSIVPARFTRTLQEITTIPYIEKIDAGDIPANIYKIQLSSLNEGAMFSVEDPTADYIPEENYTSTNYAPVNSSTLIITNNL